MWNHKSIHMKSYISRYLISDSYGILHKSNVSSSNVPVAYATILLGRRGVGGDGNGMDGMTGSDLP
jgi:hypothetical protein